MQDNENEGESLDWGEALAIAAAAAAAAPAAVVAAPITGPLVIAVYTALAKRGSRALNRYQVAVDADAPVTVVAPILEKMVEENYVEATGDANFPNARKYTLRAESA